MFPVFGHQVCTYLRSDFFFSHSLLQKLSPFVFYAPNKQLQASALSLDFL